MVIGNEVHEFQGAFNRGKTLDNYLTHTWLAMKLECQTNVKERFQLVLNKSRPCVPQKNKRASNLPTGP